MHIKNVTLVGASGHLGGAVLAALVGAGCFRVTVLKREGSSTTSASSSSNNNPAVRTVTVPDAWAEADLAAALRGEDAVVACFSVKGDPPRAHLVLASAAAAAGVARYIPADFGSVDARSERARELVPLFSRKELVRARLEELAAASGGSFTWTSLVCGHFFDWGLKEGFLHVDLVRNRMDILDRGEQRSSLSTLAQVGRAVVAVFSKPTAETANRVLFVQSFCVSQNRPLESLEKATGQPWQTEVTTSDDFVAKYVARRDTGDTAAIEGLVFALGVIDGDWEKKEDFAMELLGLQEEDLDSAVKRVVQEVEEGR
ncbi:isoflavone reductase [Magnaporthiopsis poae ATCC 64411]|uniref:Isoflavone reductase n=1 Tax=Magnaporthiopsis poae (strain ATCC 64411 / 73-15) TaxID=644358 RepID=A0A0C4DUP0_MAGP6|nr:isoflavone reductase [Magnaporthiopsis poae ATCC 64411]